MDITSKTVELAAGDTSLLSGLFICIVIISRGIEWSIRDFARPRDPCLKIRDRDSNFYIESEPETLPVKYPSPRLEKLLSRSKLSVENISSLWYENGR